MFSTNKQSYIARRTEPAQITPTPRQGEGAHGDKRAPSRGVRAPLIVKAFIYIYTSLFTKMVVKKRKKIHTYKNIQQTERGAEIKNKHMHNMHKG